MIRERTRCTEWERRVLSLSILALTCFLLSAGQPASAQVLLVSPALDQNDRIAAILENASPAIQLSQVRLVGRPNQPDAWRRSSGERGPVQLDEIRLIILENAPASGLTEIPVFGAENLLEALPAFLHAGGHLLVVGGWPSFDTYPGTSLKGARNKAYPPNPKSFRRSPHQSRWSSLRDPRSSRARRDNHRLRRYSRTLSPRRWRARIRLLSLGSLGSIPPPAGLQSTHANLRSRPTKRCLHPVGP
jgi:hypothetical protein